MNERQLTHIPSSETGMLIRRPPAQVFDAFIDPAITSQFWFTKGSGRLEVGQQIQWDWEMYDVSVLVTAVIVEPNQRIRIEWPGYGGPTTVDWSFEEQPDGNTFVTITESGFAGTPDEIVKSVADSAAGFSLVLAGLKGFLEHDIRLELVRDRFPKGFDSH